MPDWKPEIRRRLAGLKLEPTREAEIVEELSQHLEDRYAEMLSGGATPEESLRAALAELSASELLARELRRVERPVNYEPVVLGAGRKNMIADLWQDLRYAARNLRKHALLSTVVVATLTLGIGISAGVFTVINASLFRARVDQDPASYVEVFSTYTRDPTRTAYPGPTTLEDYLAFRDNARSLRDVAGWARFRGPIGDEDGPEVRILYVTCNFFALYPPGQPLLGRLLQPEDCAAANPVMVMSERLWQHRFAADPQIIGKVMRYNGQPMTIVGVTPTFAGQIEGANAWLPYTLQTTYLQRPGEHAWLNVGGRLQPSFSRGDVATELALLGSQQDRLRPERKATRIVTDGSSLQHPNASPNRVWTVSLILGALTCIVLITCANVATLLLSRAAARHQEIAVRLSLGATARRLLRMLLVETLLLAAAAGVASLYFAYRLPSLLLAWSGMPLLMRPPDSILRPDWRVFAYLAFISLLAGVLAGLAPALQSLKVNLAESLKGRQPLSGGARGGTWLRSMLVGTQVALSLVLLIGAVLFVRAYQQVSSADPGYETRQVISVELRPRSAGQRLSPRPDFFHELTQSLAALPGAQAVAFTNLPPTGNRPLTDIQVPGHPLRQVRIGDVSPAFFATLGIPIVAGRSLRESDPVCGRNGCPVVVSEELARQFWPNANPLGQTLRRQDDPQGSQWTSFEVVGVARDISTQRLGRPDDPTIYAPWAPQAPPGFYSALLRFTGDAATLERAVSAATRALAPEFRVGARTLQARIDEQLDGFQRLEAIVALLGAIAVALAMLGIYGVVSFDVSRRNKEMGIRLALGGRSRDIYGAVLNANGRPIAIGLLVGLALALAGASALARSMANAPVAMNTHDPLAFIVAAVLCAAVALCALLGPARRATRVDPLLALRDE